MRGARAWRSALGLVGVAGLWWVLPPRNSVLLPPFDQVLGALGDLAASGQLARDIGDSTARVLSGVMIAMALACLLAAAVLAERRSADFLSGIFEVMRPIPPIAWTPVAILLFGIGWAPAIAIVAVSSFFPMWLSLLKGIDGVRAEYLVAARCLGASRMILFTDVIAPSILPAFLHGLRLAVGIGWFSVIAAEMVGASTGLGHAVQSSSLNLEMTKTYAYLLVIGMIGFASGALLMAGSARFPRWEDG
jgi:ABC-type nitrate/sulfonate/bicarbonate transport system permease component